MNVIENISLDLKNSEKKEVYIIEYQEKYKAQWDEFIANSKNGTFLFYRDYMDYHSDRFYDNSLMFFNDENRLIGVLPANLKDNVLFSHGGLTYGGIISDKKMNTALMLEIFDILKKYLRAKNVREIRYKLVPHIYHNIPSEEDLYALFINNATLIRRDVSTTIHLQQKLSLGKGRKYNLKKAQQTGSRVVQNNDFATFMNIERETLEKKYGVQPVHTSEEIIKLSNRFPDNIKLFSAYLEEEMLCGVIVYETKDTVHTQYMANSDKGRLNKGLDLIINYLTEDYYRDKKYFDFGISTEQDGRYLNQGLIMQKETFGGRATVYDTYRLLL